MGYVENNLAKDEKIIFKAKLSWAKVIVGIFWFPILGFFVNLIKRASNHITLTNQRVIAKAGLIKSVSLDCKLDKVQTIKVSSGLGGKIFGYGNITFSTAGTGEVGPFCFYGGAEKMKRKIMAQIDIAQDEKTKAQAKEMAAAMASAIK